MTPKSLVHVQITTNLIAEDAVAALLEKATAQIPVSNTPEGSNITFVSVYPPANAFNEKKLRKQLKDELRILQSAGVDTSPSKISIKVLPATDWNRAWKKHFKSFEIQSELLIKPSWSQRKPRKNQKLIVLDPGLSFGTGQHPTTWYCLYQMVKLSKNKGSFLDAGTGTGILSIAAAKLGFSRIHAFDNDPDSTRIATQNAADNGVGDLISFKTRDLDKLKPVVKPQFDLICANIEAGPIISNAEALASRLKPKGALIVAGVLTSQFDEVESKFMKHDLEPIDHHIDGQWHSATFIHIGVTPTKN
ncbi:MAG: 50S ribosomal protein L11 methyltransferase [Verrucomicrobia bacterium]|nr:50S ribosomal protein L11 methyltransferase [Verrucomicrobiota bacterium]MCF7707761.1 50S ribosomal protein L11 methyltransferase [Verrucomicrobiota bacterium]